MRAGAAMAAEGKSRAAGAAALALGLISWGRDGKPATADDVHSWDAKRKTGE